MSNQEHRAYVHGYKQVSHHEWRTAENSAAYLIPVLQQYAQQNPHLTLLDVGAGSGTITASLAKYMPSGQITAADLSDEILVKARLSAQNSGVEITTRVASAYDLVQTFGESSFDVVHTSMMLCHLDDPVQALTQMVAVCKPGGVIAIREADLRMVSIFPELPALKKWHESLVSTHQGSVDGGARLLQWGLAAGLRREQMTLTMSTWVYSTPEEKKMWSEAVIDRLRGGAWKESFTEKGLMTEALLDEMVDQWQTWAQADDANYGSMHGELIIKK